MSQIRPQRPPYRKERRIRDEKYRRYVASLSCRVCGKSPCQAAHLGHSNMGLKPGDDQIVPLCPEHHYSMDTSPLGKALWWEMNVTIPQAKLAYRIWKETA